MLFFYLNLNQKCIKSVWKHKNEFNDFRDCFLFHRYKSSLIVKKCNTFYYRIVVIVIIDFNFVFYSNNKIDKLKL